MKIDDVNELRELQIDYNIDHSKNQKTKLVIIASIALFILVLAVGSFVTYKHIEINKGKATTALTPEIITRLQSYPYYQKTPVLTFQQIAGKDPAIGDEMTQMLLKYILKFGPNEKFFTDGRLSYLTWNEQFVVRGVLQKTLDDGSITEQDVEYEYKYVDWEGHPRKVIYVDARALGNLKTIGSDRQ